jgi:hypothetical protein
MGKKPSSPEIVKVEQHGAYLLFHYSDRQVERRLRKNYPSDLLGAAEQRARETGSVVAKHRVVSELPAGVKKRAEHEQKVMRERVRRTSRERKEKKEENS